MTELFKFFDQKIYWYKKYLSCNEAFLQALTHAPEIAVSELDLFYGNRESLLKILDSIEVKIKSNLGSEEINVLENNSSAKTKIQFYLREKDSIIERVLKIDSEIISLLEMIRAEEGKKLKSLSKGKRALSGYRRGENSQKKLDKRL